MRGRLRRPCRPFQVIGVLAVLPAATNSYQFHPAERVATRPTNKSNRGKFGGRLTANLTIPLSTGLVMTVR